MEEQEVEGAESKDLRKMKWQEDTNNYVMRDITKYY
jgi:hypothetical protein